MGVLWDMVWTGLGLCILAVAVVVVSISNDGISSRNETSSKNLILLNNKLSYFSNTLLPIILLVLLNDKFKYLMKWIFRKSSDPIIHGHDFPHT